MGSIKSHCPYLRPPLTLLGFRWARDFKGIELGFRV